MLPYLDLSGLAAYIGRSARTTERLVREVVVPPPEGSLVGVDRSGIRSGAGRDLWSFDAVFDHFARLHPYQAVLAPAAELAVDELAQHGVYVCPAREPGYVGLARPVLLGLKRDGIVTVYTVTDVLAEGPVPGTRLAFPEIPLVAAVKRGRPAGHGPLAIFALGEQVGSFTYKPALRQGRIIHTATMQTALRAKTVTIELTSSTDPDDIEPAATPEK